MAQSIERKTCRNCGYSKIAENLSVRCYGLYVSGIPRHNPEEACHEWKPKDTLERTDESRKGLGANVLDNQGIELDEKNPGPMGGCGSITSVVTKRGDARTSSHYSHFKIQPIDFIVANDLGFLEANVIKYVCRYPYKGSALKDLEKARQYIDWLIERENKKTGGISI